MRSSLKAIIRERFAWWLAGLILIGSALYACQDSDRDMQADSENDHVLGSVWAMVYPTILALRMADHTYVSAVDTDGNTYDWLCFGKDADGTELENTLTEDTADLTTIGFMASEPPCKWPMEYYLRIGVCYQCANRALYYTGKTVAESDGYDFFASIYGTYGDETISESHPYSMKNCIDASPPWQGEPLASVFGNRVGEAGQTYPIEDESQLYHTYFQDNKPRAFKENQDKGYAGYLDALFLMRIRKKLGADFPDGTAHQLVDIRNRYRAHKSALDRETLENWMSEEDVVGQYQRLFNSLADEYKSVLTPAEYETMFDLGFTQTVELYDVLPR